MSWWYVRNVNVPVDILSVWTLRVFLHCFCPVCKAAAFLQVQKGSCKKLTYIVTINIQGCGHVLPSPLLLDITHFILLFYFIACHYISIMPSHAPELLWGGGWTRDLLGSLSAWAIMWFSDMFSNSGLLSVLQFMTYHSFLSKVLTLKKEGMCDGWTSIKKIKNCASRMYFALAAEFPCDLTK